MKLKNYLMRRVTLVFLSHLYLTRVSKYLRKTNKASTRVSI